MKTEKEGYPTQEGPIFDEKPYVENRSARRFLFFRPIECSVTFESARTEPRHFHEMDFSLCVLRLSYQGKFDIQ